MKQHSNHNQSVGFLQGLAIVGIAGSLYILGSTVLDQPLQSLLGLGVTLLGLPVYYLLKKKN